MVVRGQRPHQTCGTAGHHRSARCDPLTAAEATDGGVTRLSCDRARCDATPGWLWTEIGHAARRSPLAAHLGSRDRDQNALLFEKKPRGDGEKRKRARAVARPSPRYPCAAPRCHRAGGTRPSASRRPRGRRPPAAALSEQLREPVPRQRVRPTPGARTGRSIVACRGDSGADIWLDRSCRPRVVNGLRPLP